VDLVKDYIETGVLELYVLGDISPGERLQVEEMMSKHAAIRTEIAEIEQTMEAYAQSNAVNPAENQRDKILNSLLTNLADDRNFTAAKRPVVEDKVIVMPARQNNFYKYAFAASVALLAASIVALYNMHNRLQESDAQLAILATQNQQISKTVSFKNEQLGVFHDTTFKMIKLNPTAHAPASANIMVAWSPVKKKVMIDMASMKMPENDKDHQYQLWALVGGKPVDLGVFDKTANDTVDMKEMRSIASAGAFAVTLEPRGGSVNPTMSELMVMSK
jgi:anti-sigma-K factor RskA